MVNFRIAKYSDASQIAEIHIESCKNQPGGFFHLLGGLFIRIYYRIFIQEKHSLILVAEDSNGVIFGFCSGTLDAAEHIRSINRNKYLLALTIMPAAIVNPKLLFEVLKRKNHIDNSVGSVEYNTKIGVRNEYWGWRSDKDKSKSPELFKTWMQLVYSFGYESFRGEVDSINKNIVLFHKFLGAKILKEVELPDGRKRLFVEYRKK